MYKDFVRTDSSNFTLCIRAHLSFKRSDSICLSSAGISGLILSSLGSDPLDKSRDTSIVRLILPSIGRGLEDCSWNFPSLKRSQINNGLIECSPAETIDVTSTYLFEIMAEPLTSRGSFAALPNSVDHNILKFAITLDLFYLIDFVREGFLLKRTVVADIWRWSTPFDSNDRNTLIEHSTRFSYAKQSWS